MSEPQDHILSAEKQRAREQAVRFIGIDRRKSSGKVLQKLLRSGYDRSLARDVVRDLIEIDYINDQRAAGKVLERYQGKRIRAKHAVAHLFAKWYQPKGCRSRCFEFVGRRVHSIRFAVSCIRFARR